jgi:hypothetical protein
MRCRGRDESGRVESNEGYFGPQIKCMIWLRVKFNGRTNGFNGSVKKGIKDKFQCQIRGTKFYNVI